MAKKSDNQKQQQSNDVIPHLGVVTQYIKDLSFENPESPDILTATVNGAPDVNIGLDLGVRQVDNAPSAKEGEKFFEIILKLNLSAKVDDKKMFVLDLTYAGVFVLSHIPAEHEEIVLAVQCPSMLFPYARQIVSSTVQNGGFQPLLLDPVDFGLLYAKKVQELQSKAQKAD